jgi:hypothetical protein
MANSLAATSTEQGAIAEFNAAVNRAYKVEAYRMVAKQIATPGAAGRYLAGMGGFTKWDELPQAKKAAKEKPDTAASTGEPHKATQKSKDLREAARKIFDERVEKGDRVLGAVCKHIEAETGVDYSTARRYAQSFLKDIEASTRRIPTAVFFALPGEELVQHSMVAERIRIVLKKNGPMTIPDMAKALGVERRTLDYQLSRYRDVLCLVQLGKNGARKVWGLPQ